jgi:uncharacterized phiE125 gp8 family phage protein
LSQWRRLTCTAPGLPALDLDVVKTHLAVEHNDQDLLIESLIEAAQARIEGPRGIGVALTLSTWVLSLDAFPACIEMDLGPVAGVTSISYVDAAGALQVLPSGDYQVDLAGRPARIVPAFGKAFPATRAQPAAVSVTFTAGSANPPPGLLTAMLMLVAHWFANRETASGAGLAEIPFGAAVLLDAHRQPALA